MLELLGQGLATMAQWKYLLPLFLGTLAGVVGGALPGVTITMTIIVLLPFTFGLDPLQGLAAMTGVYVGGSTGGLVTAASSASRGRPRRSRPPSTASRWRATASPAAPSGSASGPRSSAAFSAASFLIFVTGPLAAIALEFGPWEYLLAVRPRHGDGRRPVEGSLRQGADLDRARPADHRHRHRPDHGDPALQLRLRLRRRRLPVPARPDRHLRLRADHDRRREARPVGRLPPRPSRSARCRVSHVKVIGEILSRPVLLLWSTIVGLAHRRAAGDRRQRRQHAGLRPGEEILQAPGAVRHRHAGRHHRLGVLEQRQCRRLARHHHGLRHPGRRGHGGHARRDDDPRHPVRARSSSRSTRSSPTASTPPISWPTP